MASIAGVKFGTPCDHLIRVSVIMHFNDTLGYYLNVSAPIDVTNPNLTLFVNDEEFPSVPGTVTFENPFQVVYGGALSGSGFGFGGFGNSGFGQGGFNSGISVGDLGQFPVDDCELQYQTTAAICPKCILVDDTSNTPLVANPIVSPTPGGNPFGGGGFGQGGFGGI